MNAITDNPSPLIHVGLPKAASTFIKRAVFSRMSRNVVVPRGELFHALKRDRFEPAACREQVAAVLDSDDPLIISSENLGGGFWDDRDARTIATNLHAAWPHARVVLVLREQLDYIRSAYAFCVTKGFRVGPFERFVTRHADGLIEKLSYGRLAAMYRNLFGSGCVCVLCFEQLRGDGEGFMRQLTDFCGLPLRYDGLAGRENASIKGRRRLRALRAVNGVTWPLIAFERLIKRPLRRGHNRLYGVGEHFTLQDVFAAAVARLVSEGQDKLDLPESFLAAALPVFRKENAACGDLTGLELGRWGYQL